MREPNIQPKTLDQSERVPTSETYRLTLILIGVTLLIYWPATTALWHYWTSEVSLGGHGLLVAALALYMLYLARGRIVAAPIRPLPVTLALVLLFSIAFLVFWKAGIQACQLLLLPTLAWLAVLAAFGAAVARAVAVPIAYLYFAMPAWNLLSAPLQSLTLAVVARVAPAIGLPATVTGSLVSFPNGAQFVVTLACSGVGFLVQALAVAVLLGELERDTLGRRLRLMGGLAILALATNWIRVLLLLLIGYLDGMDNIIVSQHHLIFGYALFVIALVAFVWLATRHRRGEWQPIPGYSQVSASPVARTSLLPAVLALAVGPVLAVLLHREPASARTPAVAPPLLGGTWGGPTPYTDEFWRPVFVGKHAQWQVRYQNSSGVDVQAVAIGYVSQEQGRELINEDNSLLGHAGLTASAASAIDSNGAPYWEIVVTDAHGRESVIWTVYIVGGKRFVVPLLSQLWYGLHSMRTPPYSVLFAFRAACEPTCAAARSTLATFTRAIDTRLSLQTTALPITDQETETRLGT